MNKETDMTMKLNPYFKDTLETSNVVWSHDENSYQFNFDFTDYLCKNPVELMNSYPRILLEFLNDDCSDKQIYPLIMDSERLGQAHFIIPDKILGYVGDVKASLTIDFDDKNHDLGSFYFRMKKSPIDEKMPDLQFWVDEFDQAVELFKHGLDEFNEDIAESNVKVEEIKNLIVNNDVFKKTDGEKVQKNIEDSQYSKVLNKNFSSLKSRLDFSDSILFSQVPSGFKFIIEHTSEYQPDITVTSYRNALETELDGFDTGPVFGGETIFNVPTQLSYDRKKIFVEMPLFYALKGEVTIPKEDTLLLISGTDVLCFTVTGAQIKSGNYPGEEPVSAVRVPRELEVTSIDDKTIKLTWNRGE